MRVKLNYLKRKKKQKATDWKKKFSQTNILSNCVTMHINYDKCMSVYVFRYTKFHNKPQKPLHSDQQYSDVRLDSILKLWKTEKKKNKNKIQVDQCSHLNGNSIKLFHNYKWLTRLWIVDDIFYHRQNYQAHMQGPYLILNFIFMLQNSNMWRGK